ncbi:ATP-dependent DNA helicase [Trichonephila clavipes]|nr:ATP-dependent DNA helicase [Trichonephila clavipes]
MPLIHFGMPAPNRPAVNIIKNDVQREHQFDMTSLAAFVVDNEQLLTAEQRNVYDQINVSIAVGQCGFFFLDASGCTDKTFLISLILARIRSQNHIALALASSGIAATLLDSGSTAHSELKVLLNVHTNPDASVI